MPVSKSFACLLLLLVCSLPLPMARADCPILFADDVLYGAGNYPQSVAIGDLDGDGDADLALTNLEDENVSVLLNNGDGTFAADVRYGAGNHPNSIAIGDLDGDGDADLAVANWYDDNVSVLLNNGDGTFAADVLYSAVHYPSSVAIGDLDGDGDADLAVANFGSLAGAYYVSVLLNNGDGTFAADALYGAGYGPVCIAIGDLDGDGDADLAVANLCGDNVSVLLNNGDGTFAADLLYGAGDEPVSIAIGDLDGDGDADLAVANRGAWPDYEGTVSIRLNNGDGTFAGAGHYGAGDRPWSVVIGDLDGDGDADLAVPNKDSENVSVLLNNGDGTFAADVLYGTGDAPVSVTIGDLDGDGDADLAVANSGHYGGGDNVSVLLNDGDQPASVHNLTQGTDYTFIQCALDEAEDGDEIEVDPGSYVENIVFLDKNITLRSTDPSDADVVAATIIDGGGLDTVVNLSAGEISGFTITAGANTGTAAGGVHATGTAMVSHNIITGNLADQKGGGVTARDTVVVRNNWITNNTAGNRAGGVNARDDSLIINNYIAFNGVVSGGGGIGARENCVIRNNTIVFNNSLDIGGGILAEDTSLLLNNIIAFSTDGTGIHAKEGDNVTGNYNCVFGNLDGEYSGDAVAGRNDINVDPMLDDDELHLTDESPCVDAGDPGLDPLADETDIDGEDRILNDRVDIGCDELGVCEGDANGDAVVDPLDSGFVLARFGCPVGTGDPNCDTADMNGDRLVDPLDIGFVLARFGPCE